MRGAAVPVRGGCVEVRVVRECGVGANEDIVLDQDGVEQVDTVLGRHSRS